MSVEALGGGDWIVLRFVESEVRDTNHGRITSFRFDSGDSERMAVYLPDDKFTDESSVEAIAYDIAHQQREIQSQRKNIRDAIHYHIGRFATGVYDELRAQRTLSSQLAAELDRQKYVDLIMQQVHMMFFEAAEHTVIA